MGKIQELYDTRVRSMPPVDRLQLARLILDDLAPAPTAAVDVRDDWTNDDLSDLAAFAVQQAERPTPGPRP